MSESKGEIERIFNDDVLKKRKASPAANVGPGTENGPKPQDDKIAMIRDMRKNEGVLGEIL